MSVNSKDTACLKNVEKDVPAVFRKCFPKAFKSDMVYAWLRQRFVSGSETKCGPHPEKMDDSVFGSC